MRVLMECSFPHTKVGIAAHVQEKKKKAHLKLKGNGEHADDHVGQGQVGDEKVGDGAHASASYYHVDDQTVACNREVYTV